MTFACFIKAPSVASEPAKLISINEQPLTALAQRSHAGRLQTSIPAASVSVTATAEQKELKHTIITE